MKKAWKVICAAIKGLYLLVTGVAIWKSFKRPVAKPIPPKDVTVTPIPENLNEAREYGSLADRIERAR